MNSPNVVTGSVEVTIARASMRVIGPLVPVGAISTAFATPPSTMNRLASWFSITSIPARIPAFWRVEDSRWEPPRTSVALSMRLK